MYLSVLLEPRHAPYSDVDMIFHGSLGLVRSLRDVEFVGLLIPLGFCGDVLLHEIGCPDLPFTVFEDECLQV